MKLVRNTRFEPGFLYLAPVFDVAFILVFIVILSTSFLLQPGIAVAVPQSPFLLAPQKKPKIVSITGAPHQAVFFDNMEVTLEGLQVRLHEEAPPGTLVIKADRTASYNLVVAVTNIALQANIPVVLATDERQ